MTESSSDLQAKIENAKAGLVTALATGDRAKEIWYLGCLAINYWETQELSEVIRTTPPLLKLLSELDDTLHIRIALMERLAVALIHSRRLEEALPYLEEHLSLVRQFGELAELEADSARRLGEFYENLNRPQLAIPYYEQAANLYARLEKHYDSSEANQLLALIHIKLGELLKARYRLFLALASAQLCQSLEYESYILFDLGRVYVALGRSEGLTYYKQALACFRQRGDKENIETTLRQLRIAKTRALV